MFTKDQLDKYVQALFVGAAFSSLSNKTLGIAACVLYFYLANNPVAEVTP